MGSEMCIRDRGNAANHCCMRERTGVEKETSPVAEILYHHPETAVAGEPRFTVRIWRTLPSNWQNPTLFVHPQVSSPNSPQKWVQLLQPHISNLKELDYIFSTETPGSDGTYPGQQGPGLGQSPDFEGEGFLLKYPANKPLCKPGLTMNTVMSMESSARYT